MRFEYVEGKPGASIKEFGKPFQKISLTQSLFQAPTVFFRCSYLNFEEVLLMIITLIMVITLKFLISFEEI